MSTISTSSLYTKFATREKEEKSQLAFRIPVAIRRQQYGRKGWTSIMATRQERFQEEDFNMKSCYNQDARFTWSLIKYNVMQMQGQLWWNALIILSVVANFFFVTALVFGEKAPSSYLLYGCLACDTMFVLNWALSITIHYWKQMQIRTGVIGKSKLRLCVDAILCTSLILTIACLIEKNTAQTFDKNDILWKMNYIGAVQLYYVPLYFKQQTNDIGINRWIILLVPYILYLCLFVHAVACIIFAIGLREQQANQKSWMETLEQFTNNNNTTPSDMYFYSLHYSVMLVTSLGLGDVTAVAVPELAAASLFMIIGFCLTTLYFIGSLSSLMVNSEERLAVYRADMKTIRAHLTAVGCDEEVKRKVLRYYNELWMNKKGIKKASNMELLPTALRMELCYDLCVGPFQTTVLFRMLPEHFLRKMSMRMNSRFYLPGDTINYQHVAKYMMIIITSGVIHVLSDEDDESPIISLGFGTCISEIAMVYTLPAKSSIKAATYVEAQTLHKLDFFRAIKSYPDIHQQIRQSIEDRIEIARRKDEFRPKRENIFNLFVTRKTETTAIMQIKKILNARPDFKEPLGDYNNKVALKYIIGLYNMHRDESISPDKDVICIPSTSYPFIINPRTKLDTLWRTVVFYTILAMSVIYPYNVAFDRTYPHWFQIYCILTDIIYYIDIYMLLTTAIVSKNQNIITFKAIYTYRLNRLPFYLDLLAILPIEQFSLLMISYSTNHQIYFYLKFNRFVKIWKLWAYFNRLERNFFVKIMVVRICKYSLFMLLLSYWMGVALYIESCFSMRCRETSWYVQQQIREVREHVINPFTKHKEIMSIYFGFSTVSGAGYGDLYPTDFTDTLIVWLARILGIILFGYCIAELSELITFMFLAQTAFKESFNTLLKYISQSNMTQNIQKRLLDCYEMHWYYNGGFYVVQRHALMHKATRGMRQDVLVAERKKTLRKVPLFSSTNDDFIATIAGGSRMDILPPDEYVVYSGDVNRQMYIIHQGYCQVIEDGIPVKTLRPGAHFGIECLLYGYPSLLTIRTLTHCKVLSVGSNVFLKATDMFPLYLEHESISMDEIITKTITVQPEKPHEVVSKPKFRIKSKAKHIQELLSHSFINVKKYCELRHESYDQPFRRSNMRFVKWVMFPWCLLPGGMIVKIWSSLRLTAAFMIAMLLPFEVSISPHRMNYVHIILVISDVVAFADLYVMMFVGYYGKHGQLITHPLKTCKRYFTALFMLDFVLCIPVDKIIATIMLDKSDLGHENFKWWLNIIRLVRVGQIYRLRAAVAYLQRDILRSSRIYAIIEFVFITLIISNVWCCLFINTTCQAYVSEQGVHMTCPKGSWYDRSMFANQTKAADVYISSFYWASSQMIGYGFGDITPQNSIHIVLCILNILVGQLLIGVVYAYISSSIATQHRTLVSFQEKIWEIVNFMKRKGVSVLLRKRIQKHFEHKWKRTGGIEPYDVLSAVHTTLMEDAVQILYEETLRGVPLFALVEKSFFRILALHLCDRHYIRGEIVIARNDVIRNIFILHRGRVQVINEHNQIVCTMGPGALFGSINIVSLKPCSITITAIQNIDVLLIECEIFYNILRDYPMILQKMEKELTKDVNFIIPATVEEEEVHEEDKPSSSKETGSSEELSQSTLRTIYTTESIPAWNIIRNPRTWFRLGVVPDSPIFQIHSIMVLIASYTNMIIITYQFFFSDVCPDFLYISVCIDIVFILKIVLELQKAYVNKYGEYVLDIKHIHRRYLLNYKLRIIDIIANLPLSYLALPVSGKLGGTLFVYLRLIHVLRIYYIMEFYNEHSNMLSSASFYLKLSWLFVWFTLLIHFFACFWFFIPCMAEECEPGFWGEIRGLKKNESPFKNYIHSLYHMTNIITMTGHGDIIPMTIMELIMSIVLVVWTKIFVGVLIGEITYVHNLYSSEQVSYTRTVIELKDYMTNNHLSKHRLKKMWNYVRQLWIRDRGKQMPILYNDLPYSMKCDLMFDMYGQHIKNSYVFEKCTKDFVRQLCVLLNRYVFYPRNYIVQGGDTDHSMYFIQLGEIEVLTVHQDLTETIHDVLGVTDTFGIVQGLYSGVPHYFSFRAKTEVEIVYLCLDDWKHLHTIFPENAQAIYERVQHVLL